MKVGTISSEKLDPKIGFNARSQLAKPLWREQAERAGCISLRRTRQTGTVVGVYKCAEAGLDDDDGQAPWATVCEEHGTVISHRTRKLALSHASDPSGWCEDCNPKETP